MLKFFILTTIITIFNLVTTLFDTKDPNITVMLFATVTWSPFTYTPLIIRLAAFKNKEPFFDKSLFVGLITLCCLNIFTGLVFVFGGLKQAQPVILIIMNHISGAAILTVTLIVYEVTDSRRKKKAYLEKEKME